MFRREDGGQLFRSELFGVRFRKSNLAGILPPACATSFGLFTDQTSGGAKQNCMCKNRQGHLTHAPLRVIASKLPCRGSCDAGVGAALRSEALQRLIHCGCLEAAMTSMKTLPMEVEAPLYGTRLQLQRPELKWQTRQFRLRGQCAVRTSCMCGHAFRRGQTSLMPRSPLFRSVGIRALPDTSGPRLRPTEEPRGLRIGAAGSLCVVPKAFLLVRIRARRGLSSQQSRLPVRGCGRTEASSACRAETDPVAPGASPQPRLVGFVAGISLGRTDLMAETGVQESGSTSEARGA